MKYIGFWWLILGLGQAGAAEPDANFMFLGAQGVLPLAQKIADEINIPLTPVVQGSFADGEAWVRIDGDLSWKTLILVQSMYPDANDRFMETLQIIRAAKDGGAREVILICPYLAYSRQDRITSPGAPISAALIASQLEQVGMSQMVTLDLHSPQIQGFYRVSVQNKSASELLFKAVMEAEDLTNLVVVSPDAGGQERSMRVANLVGAEILVMQKLREAPNQARVLSVRGAADLEGQTALIVDDLIDTAGTLVAASEELHSRGAKRIIVLATHGLFSGPALNRIANSDIDRVWVTDSVPPRDEVMVSDKIRVISLAPFLSKIVSKRIHPKEPPTTPPNALSPITPEPSNLCERLMGAQL